MSIDDSQTTRTFVRAASKHHGHLQWAKIPERLWSLYILNMAKGYQQSSMYVQKTLVSRVGRQPDSSTWVLSPHVQIDRHGKEIPKQKQKFFWSVSIMFSNVDAIYHHFFNCIGLNLSFHRLYSLLQAYTNIISTIYMTAQLILTNLTMHV